MSKSKTTYLKPGQLATINNVVYRARKKAFGCIGINGERCDLDNVILCPCVKDPRFEPRYNCAMYGVILKRIK